MLDRLIISDKYNINQKTDYNLDKIQYLQKKIKIYLHSNQSSSKNVQPTKQKIRINQIEESENHIIKYNTNLQNKQTAVKSQTYKNSSVNKNTNNCGSSQKEKNVGESRTPRNRTKQIKSIKSSVISEKIDNFDSEIEIEKNENNNKDEKEKKINENINNEEKKENNENNDNNINPIKQILKPKLLDTKLFEKDPFYLGKKTHNIENDPRNKIHDNKRKKYPKIQEGIYSYIGEWKKGRRDGLGLLYLENNIKYMGYFSENIVKGYGRLWQEGGDFYQGYWKNFEASGLGIYKATSGECYDGEWQGNLQHGFGVGQWLKGNTYLGDYKCGFKNGIGILNFNNQAWYEGEFKNGIMSGIGSFFFEDGRRYLGMWKNNKMDGYGYIFWDNDTVYKGEFKEDKKEGFGIYKMKNKIFMGFWKNNKLDGNIIVVENNKIRKQLWEDGKAKKNLPDDTVIFFEKFAKKYINQNEDIIFEDE